MRHLLRARPYLRIQLAVHRYQTEEISLAKAASLAGVSWAQMRHILLERGIQPRLGPETLEEAEREVQALRAYFQAQLRGRSLYNAPPEEREKYEISPSRTMIFWDPEQCAINDEIRIRDYLIGLLAPACAPACAGLSASAQAGKLGRALRTAQGNKKTSGKGKKGWGELCGQII